jgi:hypothetical protein
MYGFISFVLSVVLYTVKCCWLASGYFGYYDWENKKIKLICFIIMDDIHAQSEYTYKLYSFVCTHAVTAATILFLLLFPIFIFCFCSYSLFPLSLLWMLLSVWSKWKRVTDTEYIDRNIYIYLYIYLIKNVYRILNCNKVKRQYLFLF